MFNSIRGIISAKHTDVLYVRTGGIEWEVSVPQRDLDSLPEVGEEGQVYTWLYHKEDQMRLFGFADSRRRSTFLELLKVDGIGPKGAVKIMGNISQADLEQALEAEDLARLEAVPGLGKKTAQKMILALKGKLATAAETQTAGPYADLVKALEDMGYERKEAQAALAKAASRVDTSLSAASKEQTVFREAILSLSGQ
ncbi:Holliday junction ATP-dependent DNA helicase RuvA [Spirochaetia bacterium]|nr:Holliday junction ATP-dependent DNA helicase RuvA [Spirochaetia bacterium]